MSALLASVYTDVQIRKTHEPDIARWCRTATIQSDSNRVVTPDASPVWRPVRNSSTFPKVRTMTQLAKFLIASTFLASAGFASAQTATPAAPMAAPMTAPMTAPMAAPASPSTSADPYVQKRDADAAAKKEYKAKKKAAKAEYKKEQSEAKSDLKTEKKESTAERKSTLNAEPAAPIVPGQQTNKGK